MSEVIINRGNNITVKGVVDFALIKENTIALLKSNGILQIVNAVTSKIIKQNLIDYEDKNVEMFFFLDTFYFCCYDTCEIQVYSHKNLFELFLVKRYNLAFSFLGLVEKNNTIYIVTNAKVVKNVPDVFKIMKIDTQGARTLQKEMLHRIYEKSLDFSKRLSRLTKKEIELGAMKFVGVAKNLVWIKLSCALLGFNMEGTHEISNIVCINEDNDCEQVVAMNDRLFVVENCGRILVFDPDNYAECDILYVPKLDQEQVMVKNTKHPLFLEKEEEEEDSSSSENENTSQEEEEEEEEEEEDEDIMTSIEFKLPKTSLPMPTFFCVSLSQNLIYERPMPILQPLKDTKKFLKEILLEIDTNIATKKRKLFY